MASKYYHIAQEMIGATMGRWSILSIGETLKGNIHMVCRCQCGAERSVRVTRLHTGKSESCGCLRNDNLTVHGRTRRSNRETSREYWIWNSMKNRCLNPKYKHFADYGGRGITVCDRWLDFKNFHADMGEKPNGKTLERIDNSKGYSPENCRWADRYEQARNKRNNKMITANGKTKTLTDWARDLGVSHTTIVGRLKSGWPEDIAVTAAKNSVYSRQ